MHGGLIADLAVVTMVAALTGMLARRVGQPSILGYLLAGLIVGPYIPIPLFADPHRMEELAEVGVVLVMFAVGLEFRIKRLVEILPLSGLTAAVQIGALAWGGFTVGSLLGWSTSASVCLGAALSISSTMVVSAVLRTRPVDEDVRAHVFGVLVVQDVVAIVLMAVVTALAAGKSVGVQALGVLVAELAAVVALMLGGGLLVVPRLVRLALRHEDAESLVVLVVGAAFGLALAAELSGFSVALGAFISGMAVAESGRGHDVEHMIEPLRALFSAIFFVSIGMTVDPLVAWHSLPLALGLSAVVIVAQLVSVTIATTLSGGSLRRGVYSGLALGQIGELSFILATIAIGGNVVPKETLPALVTVATITAFTTPWLLGRAQRIVEALDRRLPERMHQALVAYHAFLRGLRSGDDDEGGAALRRPMIALLLDWAALLIVFVTRHALAARISAEQAWMLHAATALVVAPLLVGLLRSGRRLLLEVQHRARGEAEAPTAQSRAIGALVALAVVLGVSAPTLALLRPLVAGPWVEVLVVGLLLGSLIVAGLRMGELGGEYTSGVARLASQLMTRAEGADGAAPSAHAHSPARDLGGPLAGLDYTPFEVLAEGAADGKTLAELDLRCRTGATIIAIGRADHTLTLPTAQERLQAGDLLAVSGSPEALARVAALLTPSPDPPLALTPS